ncbi:MAG: glycosyltransferase [SAR202 cluster bacterium]|nr:glycosyltransferase [SAR202 cluster bacterium]
MGEVTFVVVSFEGPDHYSCGGGLGSRVTELTQVLSRMGFETHLFFIGEPYLSGHETLENGKLVLHRWCQWISRYHPAGVYDGEEAKLADWDKSLPSWMETELLAKKVEEGGQVMVMAEEWQTATAVINLAEVVRKRGWQDNVKVLWNANNTFSFHRINWDSLKSSCTVTTVSRYMKHEMWKYGVDARVLPNGIADEWLDPIDRRSVSQLSALLWNRLSLLKVARWDPDKRWLMAADAAAELKRMGLRPLLLARGGVENHKLEVLARIREHGMRTAPVHWSGQEPGAMIEANAPAINADVIDFQVYLSMAQRKVLYRAVDAVLANSGIEPFGLVGLETMVVGGIAFVGSTGEDYATPGYDAVSIQSADPKEIVHHASYLYQHRYGEIATKMRRMARRSAAKYTWRAVIDRVLLPFLSEIGLSVPSREGVVPNAGQADRGEQAGQTEEETSPPVEADVPPSANGKSGYVATPI